MEEDLFTATRLCRQVPARTEGPADRNAGVFGPPPVNVLDDPACWQAFASECKGNSGVMDSACNKSMIGESTLQALEAIWKKKFGLGIQRLPAEEGESFKFGDAEVVEVREKAILPIGILGSPG